MKKAERIITILLANFLILIIISLFLPTLYRMNYYYYGNYTSCFPGVLPYFASVTGVFAFFFIIYAIINFCGKRVKSARFFVILGTTLQAITTFGVMIYVGGISSYTAGIGLYFWLISLGGLITLTILQYTKYGEDLKESIDEKRSYKINKRLNRRITCRRCGNQFVKADLIKCARCGVLVCNRCYDHSLQICSKCKIVYDIKTTRISPQVFVPPTSTPATISPATTLPSDMKFCIYCGSSIRKAAQFCDKCGKSQIEDRWQWHT